MGQHLIEGDMLIAENCLYVRLRNKNNNSSCKHFNEKYQN